jgi:hypothetical protein
MLKSDDNYTCNRQQRYDFSPLLMLLKTERNDSIFISRKVLKKEVLKRLINGEKTLRGLLYCLYLVYRACNALILKMKNALYGSNCALHGSNCGWIWE